MAARGEATKVLTTTSIAAAATTPTVSSEINLDNGVRSELPTSVLVKLETAGTTASSQSFVVLTRHLDGSWTPHPADISNTRGSESPSEAGYSHRELVRITTGMPIDRAKIVFNENFAETVSAWLLPG